MVYMHATYSFPQPFVMQISKALIGDDQRLRLPRIMEEKDPEETKQELIDKIASLNASIDEVAKSLKGQEVATGSTNESVTARDLKKALQL